MTSKPKLLFLCQLLPYPPDGGAPIRTYNVLRLLATEYEITILCFYRRSSARDVASSVAHLSTIAQTSVFRIEQEYSRTRLILDHLSAMVSGRVYTELAYESQDFREALVNVLRSTKFDLVHVDSLDLSGYLDALSNLPVVCVHHNIESQLLTRRARLEKSPLKRWYINRQAALMQRVEAARAPHFRLNATVSSADKERLIRIAPGSRVIVVPNGVDAGAFTPVEADEQGVIFVGGLTWFPNKDALEFFADDILPELRRERPSDNVTWVGYATEAERDQFRSKGVNLTGYVDDIRPLVHRAACFVVPLRVGGGTRLKILDAWAMGKAVVSTSVGCEGLNARDGWNILIRDDPKEFAKAVESVLVDEQLRARLGQHARETVETTYAWTVIGRAMLEEYRGVISSHS